MHAWHIILAFGFFAGSPIWVIVGMFLGKWLTLRRMTLRGKALDVIGSTYGFSRMINESDNNYMARMTSRIQRI